MRRRPGGQVANLAALTVPGAVAVNAMTMSCAVFVSSWQRRCAWRTVRMP